jgi:hypothetical protein
MVLLLGLAAFWAGCAPAERFGRPDFDLQGPITLTRPVELLPVVDLRPSPDRRPDVERGLPVEMDPEMFLTVGRRVWSAEGVPFEPYTGDRPAEAAFSWDQFPLRDLNADLGLGLTLQKLELTEIGHNGIYFAHALADAALMPLFAAAIFASNGHFDPAGRLAPSGRAAVTTQVDLNCVSRTGGGLIFSKTYRVRRLDEYVSDSDLYTGFYPRSTDGRQLGLDLAPAAIQRLFAVMAHDPELAFLPQLARSFWLQRTLVDDGLRPERKIGLMARLAAPLTPPRLTEDELTQLSAPRPGDKNRLDEVCRRPPGVACPFADPYEVPQPYLAAMKGRTLVFDSTLEAVLTGHRQLADHQMTRPLTEGELRLETAQRGLLARWSQTFPANRLLRKIGRDPTRDWPTRKFAAEVLARHPETLDNQAFLDQWAAEAAQDLQNESADQLAAAGVLAGLLGPAALDRPGVEFTDLLPVLSGRDVWAAKRIHKMLVGGYYHPDVGDKVLLSLLIRNLREDRGLDLALVLPEWSGYQAAPPLTRGLEPTAVDLIEALAAYRYNPNVAAALHALAFNPPAAVPGEVRAQAVLAAGGMDQTSDGAAAMALWQRLAERPRRRPEVRRAALAVIARSHQRSAPAPVLTTAADMFRNWTSAPPARAADDQPVQAVLRETADFFGRVRYAPAADLLVRIAVEPRAGDTLRQAAFTALGRLATPRTRRALQSLAEDPDLSISRSADRALEILAVRQAYQQQLDDLAIEPPAAQTSPPAGATAFGS